MPQPLTPPPMIARSKMRSNSFLPAFANSFWRLCFRFRLKHNQIRKQIEMEPSVFRLPPVRPPAVAHDVDPRFGNRRNRPAFVFSHFAFGCPMLRRAVFATIVTALAGLPATSRAYDIKPRDPASAFSAKMRPEILGISTDSTADSARAIFEATFKGRLDTKTDIQQQKFGSTAVGYIAALTFTSASGPKQTGEVLSTSFSSPASANRAFFVARNLTFAQDQQPSRTEMIKQVMDKYGQPTIVGDQRLYYIYRAGKIISVGVKYTEATALEAIDRPLDPRAAIKL